MANRSLISCDVGVPGDKWHGDEIFLKVNGRRQYVWRAVDQHGNVLDILVQSRRNNGAALRFFRKLGALRAKGCTFVPRVLITDKLPSYGACDGYFQYPF